MADLFRGFGAIFYKEVLHVRRDDRRTGADCAGAGTAERANGSASSEAGQSHRGPALSWINNLATWTDQLSSLRRHVEQSEKSTAAQNAAEVFELAAPSFSGFPRSIKWTWVRCTG